MNNNNLYTNNNFIGTTHLDASKITSNFILATSNILEQHISVSNLNNSNFTLATSNILETHSSNFTLATSNILETHSSNFTNKLRADVNKWINEETELTNVVNTYIYNKNYLGEIKFMTKGLSENNTCKTRINLLGELEVFYNYSLLYPTVLGGWYDVMDSIRDGYAYQGTNTILVGEVQIQINNLGNKMIALESTLGALAANVVLLNDMSVEELNQILSDVEAVGLGQVFNNASIMGISGTSILATVAGAFGYILYENYIAGQLKELQKMNNPNITEQQKQDAIQQLQQLGIQTLNSFNISLRSLNDLNGYINSNIQTQQYISSLKTDNLYVNSGNINGIDINNLKTSGSIKENNINLSDKYITSNQIYNLTNNYTTERQYPSKLYTTIQTEDTATLLSKLVYHQSLYLDNQSISYGAGFYELYSSSTYDTPTTKNRLFNYDTTETTTSARWAINQYSSGTGDYISGNFIISGYYGDWIIIKMPQSIMLTRYRIYQRTDFLTKAPSLWKCYGSTDGITFYEITEASQTTRLTSYTNGYYEKTIATNVPLYNYIGFVFSSLLSTSGQTDLSFAELQLFGKELLNQTVVSNIYTTSNVCKNLIIYDTPQVSKHFAFYCQTTTPIYINGGNTQYYKYDIDMTNYTTTGYIQIGSGSNDPYRIFRIRAFFGSCYFSKITNGLPDILHYEIYMSSKAAAGGSGTTAGINIFAVGYPNNSSLNVIPPNNLFILSNPSNNFNYITLVSTSPGDCRVIIEDLIS